MNAFERSLREHFGARLRTNYPLAVETSFKIGGPADLFLIVENLQRVERSQSSSSSKLICDVLSWLGNQSARQRSRYSRIRAEARGGLYTDRYRRL